jgi:DeoD family purine-nucleoside phosphorylase
MPQIHLHAEPGDYAPLVLIPGDPNRATRIAGMFDGGLEKARKVNDNRGLLGYTGTYHGTPVSVQTSGMGAPSINIVAEELMRLGATRLIRVGTCGGIGRGIRVGDLVIASSAAPVDGATRILLDGAPYAPTADFGLTRGLADAAEKRGVRHHVGQIATIDVFSPYIPNDHVFVERFQSRGVLAFEMEAAVLFLMASMRWAKGEDVRAGCILTVVDAPEEGTEETYLSAADLEAATNRMIEVALEAGASL